ncbi:hypothetical protein AVEN_154639-1 [Araneus ventricosus]|uniref:Uncharacterized protein n=1 Tax=Araneus ventricosus TaxID=182803 RepID=A0A4Y2WMS4_ARAVE|nr:hypothetical protein AVEN_154639-1 [Araneus ventricosus]
MSQVFLEVEATSVYKTRTCRSARAVSTPLERVGIMGSSVRQQPGTERLITARLPMLTWGADQSCWQSGNVGNHGNFSCIPRSSNKSQPISSSFERI